MKYINRLLDLKKDSKKKSLFLFGPRQTGKTSLLKHIFPKAPFYNLLLSDLFIRLSQKPSILREEILAIKNLSEPVIIDEIQKLPILLDEVHNLIEEKNIRFILTGSSARKLKKGATNMLGGRAWTRVLHPLTSKEIENIDIVKAINIGTLPSIYYSENPEEDLLAYTGNYLKEEIQAEGVVRKLENFSRFLQIASLSNTELINFENIASDCGVPARTVREYFIVLEDTLIGTTLKPYSKTKKRKPIARAKFYFFDIGVSNILAGRRDIKEKTENFGKSFEHLIFNEIKAWLNYTKDKREISFWRSMQGDEVDFLIGDNTAIEVKSTNMVLEKHLKGLKNLSEELKLKNKIVVSMDMKKRKIGDILIYPVRDFLEALWNNSF